MTASNTPDSLATMPKAELHLHLEGSIRPSTAQRLADRHGVEVAPAEAFTDFDGFLRAFMAGLNLLRDAADFSLITEMLAVELAAQNVVYAEVTTTPFNHHRRGVDMAAYTAGLDEGVRLAKGRGVEIQWILDIPRELEPPDSGFTASFILGPHAPANVAAIGLGGPEPGFPARMFERSFSRVTADGLGSVPHAGETVGPESVWEAIGALGADRIGHGVRAVEDERLIGELREHGVPLEVSLTSNVCTGVVESVETHPLPRLVAAGIRVSLNTDDPAYFFTTLTDELQLARDVLRIDTNTLASIQRHTMEDSFAPQPVRAPFYAALEEWQNAHSVG